VGRVDFEVALLDLTSGELQKRLRLDQAELVDDDWSVCQALADIAVAAGYEAVLGPSAAVAGETTLAVFGGAITDKSRAVTDRGVQRSPSPR
jgi:hypothetical protein